jgi:hypothetical protein
LKENQKELELEEEEQYTYRPHTQLDIWQQITALWPQRRMVIIDSANMRIRDHQCANFVLMFASSSFREDHSASLAGASYGGIIRLTLLYTRELAEVFVSSPLMLTTGKGHRYDGQNRDAEEILRLVSVLVLVFSK